MPKDPDILVDLTTARTDFEAQVIVESLEAQGIPARAFTTAGTALPLDLGSTLPMRVAVRRRDLQKAAAALRAIRAESVDINWDEVDVGEAEVTDSREAVRTTGRVLKRRLYPQVLYFICAWMIASVAYPIFVSLVHRAFPGLLWGGSFARFFGPYVAAILLIWLAISLIVRRSR